MVDPDLVHLHSQEKGEKGQKGVKYHIHALFLISTLKMPQSNFYHEMSFVVRALDS